MSPAGTRPADAPISRDRDVATAAPVPLSASARSHLPEYAIEAALLGAFMMSACGFTVLLEHPASPVYQAIPSDFIRRLLTGLAMGGTAVALIYSGWGQRSGAHFNPAATLMFYRLGKVAPRDALGYVLAQFLGGVLGVMLTGVVLGQLLEHERVRYAVTLPGAYGGNLHWAGPGVAWIAEFAISFVLMSVLLRVMNSPLSRHTGLFAGALVATYITLEAPISGMSMNPARTLASALAAHNWTALWIYFTAPPLGMLAAAQVYLGIHGRNSVRCAKLHHDNDKPCLFCEFQQTKA
jgi:aquaporin Z